MIARVALALLFLIAPAAAKGLFHGHGGGATSVFLLAEDGVTFLTAEDGVTRLTTE
jgi:hypothetical protein